MNDFPKCDLKKGGWTPPNVSGSLSVIGAPVERKAKDQLVGDIFSGEELQNIRETIKQKYESVSHSAEGLFRYTTGKDGAVQLGYDQELLSDLPAELLNASCGVGNPFAIEVIRAGSAVLDIGCGAGFDLIVAYGVVGDTGRVCGLDMTPKMLERAGKNLAALGIVGVDTVLVDSEVIPYADNSFDVVISNGVINLSPNKLELFMEIFRVLKPGGTLQFADIVLEKELPPLMAGNLDAWAQWIGGAVSVRDQITFMEKAGFIEVECVGKTDIRTSEYTVGALFRCKVAR